MSTEDVKVRLSSLLNRLFKRTEDNICENNDRLQPINILVLKRLIRVDCTAIEPQVYGDTCKKF